MWKFDGEITPSVGVIVDFASSGTNLSANSFPPMSQCEVIQKRELKALGICHPSIYTVTGLP